MKFRSFSKRFCQSPSACILLLSVAVYLVPCAGATPADRRTLSFVDRLMRANPLRQLANFIGRKLTLDLYHPPEPPMVPIVAVTQVPGQMQTTHYVKIPMWHKIQYPPRPAPLAMLAPVYQPYPQKYFLHGMSYPVQPLPEQQPPQQQVSQTPTVSVQPAVSSYNQPVLVTESTVTGAIQFAPNSFTTTNLQSSQLHQLQPPPPPQPEVSQQPAPVQIQVQTQTQSQPQIQYYIPEQSVPSGSVPALENLNQVEAPSQSQPMLPTEYVENMPSIVDSAHQLNDIEIATDNINPLQEQLPAPPQENLEGATTSANSMRIILIRPTDIEKTKSSPQEAETEAAEVSDFMKGYTMKFIDLDEGAQEMVVTSQRSTNSKPEVENKSCVEPLCDPFLRKLIPELLQSSRKGHKDDEPFVIIKNNEDGNKRFPYHRHQKMSSSTTTTPNYTYLNNHKLVDYQEEPEVSVVKAVEESEVHDTLQAQSSTLKPQRVQYPRKLISAKINSTFYRHVKPRQKSSAPLVSSLKAPLKNDKVLRKLQRFQNYRISSMVAPSYRRSIELDSLSPSSSESETLLPFPRNFDVEKLTSPVYSRVTRDKRKRKRVARRQSVDANANLEATSEGNERVDNAKLFQRAVGGVVFNQNQSLN